MVRPYPQAYGIQICVFTGPLALPALLQRLSGKEPACLGKRRQSLGFDLWVGKISWRRAWQPTPVFLPGDPVDRGAWRATVPGVTIELGTPWRLSSSHRRF